MVDDIYDRQWIIENAKKVLQDYTDGITIRQLHYRLVALGMINDTNHYKRVVGAMTKARWDDIVDMSAFVDRERSMYGETEDDEKDLDYEIERGKEQVKAWMNAYSLNRWSNQDNYIEVWIEKKALQGVFERPCLHKDVGLAPCKGYPSITFLYEASKRFQDAVDNGKHIIILYFGDFDPSGEDIPRSIKENLGRLGIDVEVKRMALNQQQITDMGLPGVPPKRSDSRTRNWDGGSVVELDAVEPNTLKKMCEDAIESHFDRELYKELKDKESEEKKSYRKELKDFVNTLKEDEE
jgi:hypothetical protein